MGFCCGFRDNIGRFDGNLGYVFENGILTFLVIQLKVSLLKYTTRFLLNNAKKIVFTTFAIFYLSRKNETTLASGELKIEIISTLVGRANMKGAKICFRVRIYIRAR